MAPTHKPMQSKYKTLHEPRYSDAPLLEGAFDAVRPPT